MANIHVVTPFSRGHLKETLLAAYKPMGVIFHPITTEDQPRFFEESEWVKPFVMPPCPHTAFANYKVNGFIKQADICAGDFYVWMNDDDMMDAVVADKIRDMPDDLVYVSMKRGYHSPPVSNPISNHPTYTLYACPENVKLCGISAEQMFIRGKIFKALQYHKDHPWADGMMAMALKEIFPIRYEPGLFILFNYYEPGRWEK